jgi:PPOX class probable F420-dependent enzyme
LSPCAEPVSVIVTMSGLSQTRAKFLPRKHSPYSANIGFAETSSGFIRSRIWSMTRRSVDVARPEQPVVTPGPSGVSLSYTFAVPSLTDDVRRALTGGRLAHVTTINPDGSPQVSAVWIGLEGDDIVIGHLMGGRKVENIKRDPRVALSVEAPGANPVGMTNHLVVYGRARLEAGGAPELLQRLAQVYLGPGVKFPPMPDPPSVHVIHITPQRFAGVGPWAS